MNTKVIQEENKEKKSLEKSQLAKVGEHAKEANIGGSCSVSQGQLDSFR